MDPRVEEPYRALLTEVQHDPTLARELQQRLLGPLLETTHEWIRRAQERGQVHASTDPAVVAEVLYGPRFYRWLLRTGPLDDTYVQALTVAVLQAITPSGRSPSE